MNNDIFENFTFLEVPCTNIVKLKSECLLERIGPDKGGYWKINSQYLK
jgi:hypothetical protein